MVMLGVLVPSIQAKKIELTDVQAKLVIIHNFVSRYVHWPAERSLDRNSQLLVCFLGDDEVSQSIRILEKASTDTLRVRVIGNPDTTLLDRCHVLYIASSEKAHIGKYITLLNNAPVLTFSDMDHFTEEGGMVSLVEETKMRGNFENIYVRYEINTPAIARATLAVDPDAIELARRIVKQ